jgi:hypothetical protein
MIVAMLVNEHQCVKELQTAAQTGRFRVIEKQLRVPVGVERGDDAKEHQIIGDQAMNPI